MILFAIVALITAALAYMWGARGFFSALIHLACTVVAGAIAFAAWEPMTDFLLNFSNGSFVDWAHGLALALPFAASLAVLRLATNALLPKNVDLDGITNMVGGGVCGLAAGVITTGIFVISLGYLRFESELWGWTPVAYDNSGSLTPASSGKLMFPVDQITAGVYSALSTSTLRTDENLARWHPTLASEGPLLRMNFDDGKSRHVHKPGSYRVLRRYTVEGTGLLNDSFEPNKKRQYKYLDGETPREGQYTLEGFVVVFNPSANERSGRVIIGNGQVSLLAEREDGSTMSILPAAVVSEAEPPQASESKNVQIKYGRWAFDAQKTFIATVGGRNQSPMAFEFPVPKGLKPLALNIKGIRQDVREIGGGKYASTEARDGAIRNKEINSATEAKAVNPAGAIKRKGSLLEQNMTISNTVPGNLIFQKDDLQGLHVDEARKLTDGEGKFREEQIQGRNAEPALQVRQLYVPDDQVIIQVVVDGRNRDWGFASDVAGGMDLNDGPMLVDINGITYAPYGYVYKTGQEIHIALHPDDPVTKVSDMPAITRSKPNDQLTLLFRVGKQQKIKYFAVGGKALLEIEPPFETR